MDCGEHPMAVQSWVDNSCDSLAVTIMKIVMETQ